MANSLDRSLPGKDRKDRKDRKYPCTEGAQANGFHQRGSEIHTQFTLRATCQRKQALEMQVTHALSGHPFKKHANSISSDQL